LYAWRRELPRAESGLTKERTEQEMSRSATSLHQSIRILLALILFSNSRRLATTQGEL
jgi:hypothetical protein